MLFSLIGALFATCDPIAWGTIDSVDPILVRHTQGSSTTLTAWGATSCWKSASCHRAASCLFLDAVGGARHRHRWGRGCVPFIPSVEKTTEFLTGLVFQGLKLFQGFGFQFDLEDLEREFQRDLVSLVRVFPGVDQSVEGLGDFGLGKFGRALPLGCRLVWLGCSC